MEQSFINATREHQLKSEYAFKMNKFYESVKGIQKLCAKLDGTITESDKRLINRIQEIDSLIEKVANEGWNWHEFEMALEEQNRIIQRHAKQGGFNSYICEFDMLKDLMLFFTQEDYSFNFNWETPQFVITIELSSKYEILIQNNGDINIELYMGDKKARKQTLLLETRNMQLIKNQIEFNVNLFN